MWSCFEIFMKFSYTLLNMFLGVFVCVCVGVLWCVYSTNIYVYRIFYSNSLVLFGNLFLICSNTSLFKKHWLTINAKSNKSFIQNLHHEDEYHLHEHRIPRSNHCRGRYEGPINVCQQNLTFLIIFHNTYSDLVRVKLVNSCCKSSENSSEKSELTSSLIGAVSMKIRCPNTHNFIFFMNLFFFFF